jgi:hypothetical protein
MNCNKLGGRFIETSNNHKSEKDIHKIAKSQKQSLLKIHIADYQHDYKS